MSKEYKTKGRDILLDYFNKLNGKRFCVKDIIDYLEANGFSMNQATIYRNLDKLCSDGMLLKTKQTKDDFCYYQFVGEHTSCHEHLHLQCKKCGKVVHLEGPGMTDFYKQLHEEHGFELEPSQSILIGVCSDCKGNVGDEDDEKN